MSESIINALVHLFAIIESVKEDLDVDSGKLVVKPYLKKNLNEELANEYLKLFYDYLEFYREAHLEVADNETLGINPTSMLQVAKICNQLNRELLHYERIIVFLNLLELVNADDKINPQENEFISLVAMNFNLNHHEVTNIIAFMTDPEGKKIDKKLALRIDNRMTEWPEEVAWMMRQKKVKVPGSSDHLHLYVENLFGHILVLHVPSADLFVFRYHGPLNLFMEGNKISKKRAYLLNPGSIIKGPNIRSIYESEITKQFLRDRTKFKAVLHGENLTFHFKDSTNGIQEFNFTEESGHLVAIMGGSGTGKTTLMNLLNGKLEPTEGRVHINGHTIHSAARHGVIGYVPQDDLLFEELTVYQNLYYNAKISFSNFSEQQIAEVIDKILIDLDLDDIRGLKVGDPLNKVISGGQRKRLNIALELMREPSVLFVDEPTSGLSSVDSEKVMWLLKDLTRKGKLVVAIIHQPSSDIFKLFDTLWLLDKGGYIVYNGNPVDSLVYFKTMESQVNAAESECPHCGTVVADTVMRIIEAKEIDDAGRVTTKRRVTPQDWYQKYKENIEKNLKRVHFDEILPPSNFSIPNQFDQFTIFSRRNLRAKLANRQYVMINLFQPALLAFILAYLSKYTVMGGEYIFAENKNLPVYMFMGVVVALFLGMSVSAEEIFKDRRIVERESFLNLSRVSYLNSKIFFLFALSAIQTLSFVLIGNTILEIKGMTLLFWLILFSTSCFANLVGLNISAALNSIITIYILIPFLLVPQLLLGGAMISFDDLHHNFSKKVYVPVVGDLMASRWAYEAMAVSQFKRNEYQRYFYEVDDAMSDASYYSYYLIPKLQTKLENIVRYDGEDYEPFRKDLRVIRNTMREMIDREGLRNFVLNESLTPELYQKRTGDRALIYLEQIRKEFQDRHNLASSVKDSVYQTLVDSIGKNNFNDLRADYRNEKLADLALNQGELNKTFETSTRLIRKKDPIYMDPTSKVGRAHFYAPVKIIGSVRIPTIWFNAFILWLMTGFLYLMLIRDWLRKILLFLSGRKRKVRNHPKT